MKVYFNDNVTPQQDTPEMKLFCVEVKLQGFDNNIVITYKDPKSATIKEIGEVGTDYFCKFTRGGGKGKQLACDWLHPIKLAYSGMKPNDWMIHNPELLVDAYHKIH